MANKTRGIGRVHDLLLPFLLTTAEASPGEAPATPEVNIPATDVPAEDETPADDPTPATPAKTQLPAPTEAEGHTQPAEVKIPATHTEASDTAIPSEEDLPGEVPVPDKGLAGPPPGEVPEVPTEDETPADAPTPATPATSHLHELRAAHELPTSCLRAEPPLKVITHSDLQISDKVSCIP